MKIHSTFPPSFPDNWYIHFEDYQAEKQLILDALSHGDYKSFFIGYGNPLWLTCDGRIISVATGKLGCFNDDFEREFDGVEFFVLVLGRYYFTKYVCDDRWNWQGHNVDYDITCLLEDILKKELDIKCFLEGDPQIPEKAFQLHDSLPCEDRAVVKLAYKVINSDGVLGELEWSYVDTYKEEVAKMDAYLAKHQLQEENKLIDLGHEHACDEWDYLGMFFCEVDCVVAERGIEGYPDINLFINPSDYKVQFSFDDNVGPI